MNNVQIKWGGTRFVVLWGDKAYKIARFPFLRAVFRLIQHLAQNQVKERLQQFGASPQRAIFRYLFCGILANRDEWYISKKYPDQGRAKALSMHLLGLMVVQERGDPLVPGYDPETHPLWRTILAHKRNDVQVAREQFARFGDTIKLIDMGREDLDPGMFV